MTVDLCSVMAGNIKGCGMFANMVVADPIEVILLVAATFLYRS